MLSEELNSRREPIDRNIVGDTREMFVGFFFLFQTAKSDRAHTETTAQIRESSVAGARPAESRESAKRPSPNVSIFAAPAAATYKTIIIVVRVNGKTRQIEKKRKKSRFE